MTLIVSAINDDYAFANTDTLVTKAGVVHDSDAVKSMRIDTSDGSFLLTYTGLAELRHIPMGGGAMTDVPTAHVLAMELTDFKAPQHTIAETISFVCKYLESYMKKYHAAQAQRLTMVISGWLMGAKAVPKMYVVSNGENQKRQWIDMPTHKFQSYEATNEGAIVRGYMPATATVQFQTKLKHLKKILPKDELDNPAKIRDKMTELINISAVHPEGRRYIGDEVMGSILSKIHSLSEVSGIDFKYYPDRPFWIGPNVVGRTMSIIEPKTHNDPLAGTGGNITIGGSVPTIPYNVFNDHQQ